MFCTDYDLPVGKSLSLIFLYLKCDAPYTINFLLDTSTLNVVLFSVFNLMCSAVVLFMSSLPSIKLNYSYLWNVFLLASHMK